MGFDRATLFFFSGTGNARRAAIWSGQVLRTAGIHTDVHEVGRIASPKDAPSGDNLLGFFFPTHGFTAIWAMLKFVLLFPKAKERTSVFAVATRAGLKFGSWFVPGYEGNGLLLVLLILRLKGYSSAGSLPLDMPSNWTAVHPSLPDKSCIEISERCRNRVESFTNRLFDGEPSLYGWKTIPLGIALLPLSAIYLLLGRFFLAKTMIADSRCTGCRLCERACPVGAIRFRGNRPYWTYGCESCQRCINFCPKSSIQSSHSMALGLYFLIYGGLFELLLRHLYVTQGIVRQILFYGYALIVMWVGYELIYLAARWRPINLLIEYTNLTRYFRRYREPETEASDFLDQEDADNTAT